MPFSSIKELLKTRIGLKWSSIGESSVKHAVEIRQAKTNSATLPQYIKLLESSSRELYELIEEIVVPETWFYRNGIPFENIGHYVKEKISNLKSGDDKVCVLSIPCSTGEEPYSIAMSLLDCKVDISKVIIDAIDISRKSICKAEQGIFRKNAFREMDVAIQSRYFKKKKNEYVIDEKVKNMVNFKQGNITIGAINPKPGFYDVIFCRNLLIYFDSDLQKQIIEKIYRSLKPAGLLFVGPAEGAHIDGRYFSLYGDKKASSFQRVENVQKVTISSVRTASKNNKNISKHWDKIFDQLSSLNKTVNTKTASELKGKSFDVFPLTYVEKMITNAKYQEAERYINQSIDNDEGNANVYFLLAKIKYLTGEERAAESLLKKAVYLDSSHEQTILLLKEMAAKKGDAAQVSSYQRRLNRINKK